MTTDHSDISRTLTELNKAVCNYIASATSETMPQEAREKSMEVCRKVARGHVRKLASIGVIDYDPMEVARNVIRTRMTKPTPVADNAARIALVRELITVAQTNPDANTQRMALDLVRSELDKMT